MFISYSVLEILTPEINCSEEILVNVVD